MPFASKAQQRYLFANKPKMARRWAAHTPDIKNLPERAKEAGERLVGMMRALDVQERIKQAAVSAPPDVRPYVNLLQMLQRSAERYRMLRGVGAMGSLQKASNRSQQVGTLFTDGMLQKFLEAGVDGPQVLEMLQKGASLGGRLGDECRSFLERVRNLPEVE